jgi:hypothetical protein
MAEVQPHAQLEPIIYDKNEKNAGASHQTSIFDTQHDPEKSRTATPDVAPSAASPRQMTQVSWVLVLIAILSAVFLFALDNTVVADVQPKIINVFGEVDKLPWASTAFALGAVAVNLFWLVPR